LVSDFLIDYAVEIRWGLVNVIRQVHIWLHFLCCFLPCLPSNCYQSMHLLCVSERLSTRTKKTLLQETFTTTKPTKYLSRVYVVLLDAPEHEVEIVTRTQHVRQVIWTIPLQSRMNLLTAQTILKTLIWRKLQSFQHTESIVTKYLWKQTVHITVLICTYTQLLWTLYYYFNH
jgi:hypothetical protein